MYCPTNVVLNSIVFAFACIGGVAYTGIIDTQTKPSSEAATKSRSQAQAVPSKKSSTVTSSKAPDRLPGQNFTHPPEKSHDPDALFFTFDQLEHWYRVPGEFRPVYDFSLVHIGAARRLA